MLNVLSVASECAPLVKTGGLADVVGALPAALAHEGVGFRTLLPGYPAVLKALGDAATVYTEPNLFGGPGKLLAGTAAGLDLLVIDAPHLYDRGGSIYLSPKGRDWPDNPERFAALCWMAARIGMGAIDDWRPDVLHCHDWQAGWVPEYLHDMGGTGKVGTVMTIHNIAFQGNADAAKIPALRLRHSRMTKDGYEFWGRASALKAGLMGADKLTTVSPTYARELMTDSFGMGLDGVMRLRSADLSGILNGIDEEVWNPATDPEIKPYKTPRGKAANKAALRAEIGLDEAEGPLCVMITRLTEQKGVDLLLEAMPTLLARGGQLAVLGSGDPAFEDALRNAARNDQVAVHIGYDEALSHRMIAGGDAILVPSRFEPCGLTQLYGLRYGTIPVVGLTGGLADTVINASTAALDVQAATGIQFNPITAQSLRSALSQLCDLYADSTTWAKMQKNAMRQPVGWGPSARAYAALYRDIAPSS
ncbi:glycogen synthase GlgA [Flavimaricola marinus]|uniref:Glycogen synthase n=1 Tax=Flavimaricola marinus TaxID=1819565 RepID=A0A238LIV0_9RHOB|nr:glycogen synthase GlgA [Flavimaricola marinus]SMY09542.1 Glycogen synthase 1 [Flavimaricola marinus]